MDALVHCLEAYLSTAYHPPADGIALDGLRRAALNLEQAVGNGGDVAARRELLAAALNGGLASQKGFGGIEAAARGLEAEAGARHGALHAALLPEVLAFNRPAISERFDAIRAVLGLKPGDGRGRGADAAGRTGGTAVAAVRRESRARPSRTPHWAPRRIRPTGPTRATRRIAITAADHGGRAVTGTATKLLRESNSRVTCRKHTKAQASGTSRTHRGETMSDAVAVFHGDFGRVCLYSMDRRMVPHGHREGHLIFHVQGPPGQVVVNGKTWPLSPGQAVAISPWQAHYYDPLTLSGPTLALVLYIRPGWFLEAARHASASLAFGRVGVEVTDYLSRLVFGTAQAMLDPDREDLLLEDRLCALTQMSFDQSWQWTRAGRFHRAGPAPARLPHPQGVETHAGARGRGDGT
jgi:hypothetical protein